MFFVCLFFFFRMCKEKKNNFHDFFQQVSQNLDNTEITYLFQNKWDRLSPRQKWQSIFLNNQLYYFVSPLLGKSWLEIIIRRSWFKNQLSTICANEQAHRAYRVKPITEYAHCVEQCISIIYWLVRYSEMQVIFVRITWTAWNFPEKVQFFTGQTLQNFLKCRNFEQNFLKSWNFLKTCIPGYVSFG